jgi:glycosyltransferase involved in cell wall biosynthesis
MSIKYFDKKNNFEKYKDVKSILIVGDNALEKPFFSIVIPTYKRTDLFAEALKSAVNQDSVRDYEILVVDNEPYDGTINEAEKIVRSFTDNRIKYYRNESNIGMFGNWNRCIELAKSNWICMLHDDDYLDSRYLYEIRRILILKPEAGVISSRFNVIKPDNNDTGKKFKCFFRTKIKRALSIFQNKITHVKMFDYLFGYSCPIVGSCFSKSQAIELGGFDEGYYPSSDYIFIAKICHYYNDVYFYRKPIYNYRIFANASISIKKEIWCLDDYYINSFLIKGCFTKLKPYLDYINLSILKKRIDQNSLMDNAQNNPTLSFVDVDLERLNFNIYKKEFCRLLLSLLRIYKYYIRL